MSIVKKIKDQLIKALYGKESVPRGLFDLHEYFRIYKQINFDSHNEDGIIVAVSKDFKQGSIVTSGINREDLDKNIKDAILTVFSIPSSYAKEAAVARVGENSEAYALA
ncbi:MAG: hypothetical protein WCT26_04260 [Candidatus Buchananbacteria bacterium]